MRKVIVFGNSGAGKSTFVKKLQLEGLAHLDLDIIAWDLFLKLLRKALNESKIILDAFLVRETSWVIEGC